MSDLQPATPTARDRALKVLLACHEGQARCQEVMATLQRADPMSAVDMSLATELVLGVLRHRLTAEHLASRFYRGRWAGLRSSIRMVLALAVYQLCWLDRIPDHAAVDQAVRQAKRYGKGTAAMVNALLRKLLTVRGEIVECPESPNSRQYLAIDERRGRIFAENIFPDPERRPLDYLIAATSHPSWLVERWHRRFKPALCRTLCEAGMRRAPLSLRPNGLRISADALFHRLAVAGQQPERLPGSDAVLLRGGTSPDSLAEFQEGLCQPQDSTAQIALTLAPPRPGEFVLDLCAGVGTKSTQAAELMNNLGLVVAADIDGARLEQISPAAERLGLTIIRCVTVDQLDALLAQVGRATDLILLDVPCTNTGVLARRPEARYRASARNLSALVEIQRTLLQRAAALAAPATRIIYSTCSLEREENEEQVAWFTQAYPRWRISTQTFTTPDRDHDGGFAAVLGSS